ncbi:MAG: DUF3093 family protein [Actinobacteria bacterium]|jgi:hypothetical protein|uniref:Unannotated protein n=1 Tax=freshwater metagenome TaxID=449393 RepID=A0A6J6VWH2_9ZZZZ|nr:DUF3093 family protein [Actinomycetota bacterium]MSY35586.1 DUF3093 family protein [Actinomycetota bacterium]MTA72593.1 DUF3093 family protein [Actinomycetota bacterium]MTB29167.1 DUF3093 family protein [Actinomycetota bacterium]MUH48903.1 DUF3093 family protein [Actinomycetota bacterium]
MRFREVVRMPLWLLLLIYFFFLSFVVSIWAALGNNAALVTLAILTSLLIFLYVKSSLEIQVDESQLWVGKAHIEYKYIGATVALTANEMKNIRTRDADPSAHLEIRFWNPHGVKIHINDSRDVTPYWLVTSKKSEELSKLLNSLKN